MAEPGGSVGSTVRIELTDRYIYYIVLYSDMLSNMVHRSLRAFSRRKPLLLKTIGYRILSVLVTALIAFMILRDVSAALDIGIWANLVKMLVYYAYERAWSGAVVPEA